MGYQTKGHGGQNEPRLTMIEMMMLMSVMLMWHVKMEGMDTKRTKRIIERV